MKAKPDIFSVDAAELRRRAESKLRKQQQKKTEPRTEVETQRLLHELQVHQIELEMQNVELQDTRDEVEAGLVKYTDLYDFAPVGYFSIDEQGLISEVNLTGAALLGVERSRLVKRRLLRFVASTSRPIFSAFLEKVFAEPGKQVCEAELLKDDGTSFWADLQAEPTAFLRGTRKVCRLAVSDITPLKRAEEAQARTDVLAALNRELTQEIDRRKVAEEDLRKSEQQTSQLLAEALQMQKRLRHLSHQVLHAQEEERKRISRELHDEVAQSLTAVNLNLALLKSDEVAPNVKGFKRKIAQTQKLVIKSMNIVHQFASQLRPAMLDDLGLIPALHSYVNDFAERTGLSIRLTGFTRDRTKVLNSVEQTVLYRVAQESLTNVAKHSQASQVEMSIHKLRGVICMEVTDNGKSFDARDVLSKRRKKRLGLLGMRERVEMVGGTLSIESEPGQGTSIRVEIPFTSGNRS